MSATDPAFEYLDGFRSLLAIPMFDNGESLNAVILLHRAKAAFDPEQIPDLVWRSNLFGRATGTLVLKSHLEAAYKNLDHKLKSVAQLQRALLPAELPKIPRLEITDCYQPARAGGLPLGVMEDAEYNESSFYLQFDDQIVLYTDGITETHNAANEQFGESRIDDVLSKCGLDSAELMRNLLTAVDEFANGIPPHDDRTVIVLRATRKLL